MSDDLAVAPNRGYGYWLAKLARKHTWLVYRYRCAHYPTITHSAMPDVGYCPYSQGLAGGAFSDNPFKTKQQPGIFLPGDRSSGLVSIDIEGVSEKEQLVRHRRGHRRMKKLAGGFGAAILLWGCVTSSGILILSPDTYTINVVASQARGGVATAKRVAYEEANEQCAKTAKQFSLINEQLTVGLLGNGAIDLHFRCVPKVQPDSSQHPA